MFTYLRYFSILSSIAIVLAAFVLGYYFRTVAQSDVESIINRNNRALAQGFINTTWKSHWANIEQLYQIPPADWKKYREFAAFSKDVFLYFEDTPVAKVNIYSPAGRLMLSTDQSEIIVGDEAKGLFGNAGKSLIKESFGKARSGAIANNILNNVAFRAADGSLKEGVLVQTLVPILADSYVPVVTGSDARKQEKIMGIIEIYFDVTDAWKQMILFQVLSTGGIILIFMVLILVLMSTSRRAEAIIAKQHEANVELAAQAATAQTENQNKSQFLANISHELRTPLNAIIGFSEIMKAEMMGTFENTRYQDYIRDIHGSGVHLLSLINDILDYSKAEAGKLELEITEVDATKTIQNSMRLVTPRAEAAEVKLIEEIPKEHIVLHTDAKKLKQVMLNLLSNAVKFTPPGGEVKVSAWIDAMENAAYVRVQDSGIGIAPKDISRAMAPFGQVDSTLSRKYDGTGLGLPLTYKFVQLLGGTFAIESTVNVGTTITFSLPIKSLSVSVSSSESRAVPA